MQIPVNHVENLAHGDMNFLPDEPIYQFKLFNKIMFLYLTATEDKDLKLSAFLEVLISYHGLSQKTIAKMASVATSDIEKILSYRIKFRTSSGHAPRHMPGEVFTIFNIINPSIFSCLPLRKHTSTVILPVQMVLGRQFHGSLIPVPLFKIGI